MNVHDKSRVRREIGLALIAVNVRKLATAVSKIFNTNKEIAIKLDNHQVLSLFLLSGLLFFRNSFFV